MLPWTHLAFGYVLFLGVLLLSRRPGSRAELLALLAGTQVPDVIDKPLAWWVQLLPSGRSLAHSLLFAVPVVLAAAVVARRYGRRELGPALAVGYASHLLGDTYAALWYWRTEELTFLLWPLLPPYPYDEFTGFLDFALRAEVTTSLLVQSAVAGVGLLVLLAHFARVPWWPPERRVG
ncbi:metal-dependent hydrolase [Haloarcula pelagica]|uniref:metal-dependent hydrolase n=1 Tax=Haloarcula pelagica TaxID=3033389 RepID=UPI0024C25459|nr:metal-dependent hydrolase [Halomicroarcula sp. YJ-61-S]